MKKFLLLLMPILLISGLTFGQVVVSGSVGADGTYTSLTNAAGAFLAINSATQTSATIVIKITGDVANEAGTNSLNAGAWTTLTIKPDGGAARTISGTVAAAPMINLNGADYVTIDGLNSGGNSLTISNLSNASTSGTSTIRFIADASNNTVTNTTVLGSAIVTLATNGGTIFISTGTTTGNDNITISNCKIGPAGTNLPSKSIFASGSTTSSAVANSNLTITNCEIYDFFLAGGCAGFYALTGNTDLNITSNKIYQTASRAMISTLTGIYFSNSTYGNNIQITGNTIGYASNSSTGTFTMTGSGTFQGIFLSAMSSAANACNINSNVISDISLSSTSSSSSYCINNGTTAGSNTININSNTIRNIALTSTTGIFYIINTGGATTLSVTSNTLNNITRTASGAIYGIALGTGTNCSVSTNTITNLAINSSASTSALYGIYTSGSPVNITAIGNTITYLTSTSTAALTIRGIADAASGAGSKTYQNNIINNFSAAGGATIVGIYTSTASTPNALDISGNVINTFSGGLNEYGVQQSSSSATTNIYKNKIYDLAGSGTAASVYGIYLVSGTTQNIYNNLIGDLRGPTATGLNAITGIYGSATSTYNIYYNSVYLSATSTSATTFGTSCAYFGSTITSFNLRNNILVNLSTPAQESSNVAANGISACLRRSTGTGGTVPANYATTSNNNDFWCNPTGGTNNHLIYAEGTTPITNPFNTLAALKTFLVNRDQQSIADNPLFLSTSGTSASFLHINTASATQLESGAGTIASYSTDFDGDYRFGDPSYTGSGSAPDIGADEFSGTTPAPVLSAISISPTIPQCPAAQRNISVNVTTSSPYTITGVTITYNNGTATGPVPMTNSTGNTWIYTIPAASPGNTTVTWSITASNSISLTTGYTGTPYQDEPLTGSGLSLTASATPATICSGSSSVLTALFSSSAPAATYTSPTAVSNPTTDEDCGNVTFGSLNNTSAINSLTGSIGTATGTAGSYSNFTSFGPYDFTTGLTYSLSVSTLQSTTPYGNAIGVYIDYNRNGVFTDAGEAVYVSATTTSGAHTETASITIPASAKPGLTRMRVVVNEGTVTGPTMSVSYGEYEEYSLNIKSTTYPGFTYSWSDGINIVGTTNPLTLNPPASLNYTFTASVGNGCNLTGNTSVTVASGVLIVNQPVSISGCPGHTASFTINATGAALTFQWRKNGTPINTVSNPSAATSTLTLTNISIADEATYDVEVSSSCGSPVTSDGASTLTVYTAPPVAVTPLSGSYCTPSGSAVALTANGANSYSWSPSAGLDATTGNIVHASPALNTTYIVTGTDGNGCTNTASAIITVGASVILNTIDASPPSVCAGGSTTLTANAYSDATGTYCVGPFTTGTVYGDYIINVTLGSINNTTGASSSPYNTYYSLLTTNLTGGSGYTLTGTVANGGTEMVAAWIDYNHDGAFDASEKLGEFTGLSYSIPFTVPLTAYNGKTRMRVRNLYNTAGILPCASYAYGEIEDYNVFISGAYSPFDFTWNENPASGTLQSTTTNPTTADGINSDITCSVIATAASGCSATGNVTVTLGVPIACAGITNTNACDGVNFTVTANTTGGGGTLHYAWSDDASGVYPDAKTVTANLSGGSHLFSVTVTDGCGTNCSMDQNITIGLPPGGTADGPATGYTYIPMDYAVTGYEPGSTFQWQYSTTNCSSGFTPITGATTNMQSLTAGSTGTFYINCIVTGPNGCHSTTNCVTTVVVLNGDNVCSAIPLSIGLNGPYTNVGATIEPGEPVPPGTGFTTQTGWASGQTISNTIWFSFTAPPSGRISIGNNPLFTLWDNQFALYSGDDCNGFTGFTLLAANDDSSASVSPFKAWIAPICLNPGQTYYLQVDGYGAGINSSWGIRLKDEGNAPPTIAGCPTNISIPANAAGCSANVSWTAPTATDPDNCLTPLSFTSNYVPGANFPLGTTTVTYTASDGVNLPVTCSFTVTVLNTTTASISGNLSFCAGTSTLLDAGSFAGYNWSTGATTQTISVNSAGTYSVTVTDLHGCTAFSAPVTTTIIPLPEAPGSVSTSWITPTSFDLSWAYTAGVVPVNYTVEVSTNSSFIGGGIAGSPFTVIYPVTSLSLSGLPENTEYFFRIKANSVSCPSAYSAGSVSTLCAPSMAPFTEDFETPSFVPACWANVAVYGSGLWSRSTAASANGYGHASALANFYDQASGTYELKTKPFNISGLTTPTLKFNYAYATYVVENDELDVYYSTNFGATWTALLLMPGGPNGVLNTGGASEYTYVPTASQWCTQSIELPAGTNMVKFTAISAFGNNLYLDNISVANTAAEFSTVQNITVAGSEHYEATNAIDVAGGGSYFTVPSGASATFVAGTRISFLPGTTVQSGGYMLGHIATDPVCSNTSPTGPAILNGYQSHDTQGSVNFTLYPNPTSGNFTIVQKGDKQSGTVHVEIYSMRGEKLVSDSMIGEKMHDFNLEGFPAGLYFVKIIAEDYTETIKLVKTR